MQNTPPPSPLTLPQPNMTVPRRRPRKLHPTLRTTNLRHTARPLALMSQQITESAELAAVAAMPEAARFLGFLGAFSGIQLVGMRCGAVSAGLLGCDAGDD